MQRHLREALLLQVRDDALPAERAALDHGEHLVVLALDERQLEHVLAGVDLDLAVAPVAVQAVQHVAENLGEVDGHVQRADDPGVAVGQRVLDVVERGVDEHPGVVPGAALDADGLVHGAGVPELAVGDHDGVLREHRHQRHVGAPHHVLDLRRGELRHRRSLLHVVQDHLVLGAAQQSACAGVEDGVRLRVGGRALLRHLVAQILDQDGVRGFIQHGKSVARHENRAAPRSAPRVRGNLAARVGGVLGQDVQLVRPAVRVVVDQNCILRGVVRQTPRTRRRRGAPRAADGDERVIALALVIVRAQVAVLDVVQRALVVRVRGALALELEHDHAAVVPRREKVHLGVRGEDPESIVLAAKRLRPGALGHVPDANGLVLRVGDDDVLPGVEHHAGDVVDVPAQRVHLPRFGVVHAPQLHLAIVRARDDERQGRVERRPVDAAVVSLEDVLHHRVAAAEQVVVHVVRAAHAVRVVPGRDGLLAQTADVPHAHSLVQRRRHDQVLLGVEHRRHDVVVVPGEHRDAVAALPVPDADGLVVARGDDPGVLLVELHRADVVQVPEQREQAPAELIVPNLDLVIVACARPRRRKRFRARRGSTGARRQEAGQRERRGNDARRAARDTSARARENQKGRRNAFAALRRVARKRASFFSRPDGFSIVGFFCRETRSRRAVARPGETGFATRALPRRTSGHEQRLGLVEAHPADGSVVLVEPIDERPHPVIPQLDHPAVQRREDPWPLRVEREALHAVRLGLRCVAFVRTWADVNEANGSARSMETRAIEPRRVRNPETGYPFNKDGASPRSRVPRTW